MNCKMAAQNSKTDQLNVVTMAVDKEWSITKMKTECCTPLSSVGVCGPYGYKRTADAVYFNSILNNFEAGIFCSNYLMRQ